MIVAKYHERCMLIGNSIAPSRVPGFGKDYLELADSLSEDEKVELLGVWLMCSASPGPLIRFALFTCSGLHFHEHNAPHTVQPTAI